MRRGWMVALLMISSRVFAQDSTEITDGFRRVDGPSTRKTIATAALGAVLLITAYDDYNVWWKSRPKPFSWFSDGWLSGGQLGLDKVGHFFGSYCFFKCVRNGLLWGGYSPSTAMWWGVGVGLWNGLRIEIGDGFSPYGFDYQDLTFDFLGVAYGLLQSETPFLQNFTPKFSYWSSKGIASPANFVQHYDALTIWMTVNVHNLLPTSVDKYWPECIQLAGGFSLNGGQTRRRFCIGLDFNLSAFETDDQDIHFAERLVEVFHLPAPAVRFEDGQKPVYKGIYLK